MASVRNKDRLLDAAREVILSVGWRRATVTDVARRAGVSRMTVYRTYPDMQSILADLMTREWVSEISATVDADDSGTDGIDTLSRRFAMAVLALRDNTLFRRIVEIDPEQLLPYLIDRRGRSQDAIVDLLAARIERAQTADVVRTGSPLVLARSLMLAAHGFALSIDTMVGNGVSRDDLDQELTNLVRRYLAR